MLELIFSLTGVIFGIILANIAPEEILPGKKYFLWLKRILLFSIFLFIGYNIFLVEKYLLLILLLLLLILFILELKLESNYYEIGYYFIFILAYVFLSSTILAVLIFLYGLPTGTLLFKNKL